MSRRETAVVDELRIATPCRAEWDEMEGDERVRHCRECDKNVYDVSAMTRSEVVQLLRASGEVPPCIRLYRRADGTVMTRDCPVGVKRTRLRVLAAATAAAVSAMATGLGIWRARQPRPPTRHGPGAELGVVRGLPHDDLEPR